MLKRLEALDWGAMRHAYGPANDLPAHLRMLFSRSARKREQGFYAVSSLILHQGTVYEVTAHVVPLLISLLATSDAERTVDLLEAVHARPNTSSRETWIEILGEQGRDLETETRRELGWVQAARAAVAEGRETYRELLRTSSHAETRTFAAYLLALFPEDASITRDTLLQAFAAETDTAVRAGLVWALAALAPVDAASRRWLADTFAHEQATLLRFPAALGLVASAPEPLADAVWAFVLQAVAAASLPEEQCEAQDVDAAYCPGAPWPYNGLVPVVEACAARPL